jgi:hypothetical protein
VDEPIEVTMHPVLVPQFEEWLASRGLMLARAPEELQDPEHLEAFIVVPTQEMMRRHLRVIQ